MHYKQILLHPLSQISRCEFIFCRKPPAVMCEQKLFACSEHFMSETGSCLKWFRSYFRLFSPELVIWVITLSRSSLCFILLQMFSVGERSGLQAGQSSTKILLLRSHAVGIDAVCFLTWSYWNMQGFPRRRRCLDGSKCCSKTSMYVSALMELFQMCRFPGPYTLMPPVSSELQALN